MAGCTSTTEPLPIDEEGLEFQDEERKDLEHKKNIEELELQQSELLEGLLEEDSFAESLSEVADDSEQDTDEVTDVEAGDESELLATTELETEEIIEPETALTEVSPEEETKEPSLMELLKESFDFDKDASEDTLKITAQQEPQLPPTPSLPGELAVIASPEQEPDPPKFTPESQLAMSSARKLVSCSLVPELMDEIHQRLQKTKDISIADRRLRDTKNDRLMPVVHFDFDQTKIKPKYLPNNEPALSSAIKLISCKEVPEKMVAIYKRLLETKDINIADRKLRDSNNDTLMPIIHFDFDQTIIKKDYRELLRQQSPCVMKALEARGDMILQIEGHADERGSDEYNMALGHRRANAVSNSIIPYLSNSKLSRIFSYGEEFPLVDGSNKKAWDKNRRVEFTLLLKP